MSDQRVTTTEPAPAVPAVTDEPVWRDDEPATSTAPAAATPTMPKAPAPPKPAKAQATAPVKPVARNTRVVLRRLDPWSVLKLSLVYYLALFVVLLVAATLLWAGATAVGVVGNIEGFFADIGFEDFRFLPGQILRGVALGGLVLVIAGTCANVLMTALFNLMSDVVGGLKLTLEEDRGRDAKRGKSKGSSTV